MKFFNATSKGAVKSAKTYKLILTAWLLTFLMIWPAALVIKSSFNSVFGKSMISQSLSDGFDIGILADMSGRIAPFIPEIALSTLFIIFGGGLLNVFFAGGFFDSYTSGAHRHNIPDFLKSSARYFMPYLGLTSLVLLMIISAGLLIIGIPMLIAGRQPEGGTSSFVIVRISVLIWFFTLPLFLLVADHGRIWMASTRSARVFRAIGKGFRNTFRHFWRSYFSVLAIMAVSVLILFLSALMLRDFQPVRGIFIFLFFLLSQAAAVMKIWTRCWRYATVSELITSPDGF